MVSICIKREKERIRKDGKYMHRKRERERENAYGMNRREKTPPKRW